MLNYPLCNSGFLTLICLKYREIYLSPFVRGIQCASMYSSHERPTMQALMVSLLLAWISCWSNSRVTCDLRLLSGEITVISDQLLINVIMKRGLGSAIDLVCLSVCLWKQSTHSMTFIWFIASVWLLIWYYLFITLSCNSTNIQIYQVATWKLNICYDFDSIGLLMVV